MGKLFVSAFLQELKNKLPIKIAVKTKAGEV
jgi:hypothetical protein